MGPDLFMTLAGCVLLVNNSGYHDGLRRAVKCFDGKGGFSLNRHVNDFEFYVFWVRQVLKTAAHVMCGPATWHL